MTNPAAYDTDDVLNNIPGFVLPKLEATMFFWKKKLSSADVEEE